MTVRTTEATDPDAPARAALMDEFRVRRRAAGIGQKPLARHLGVAESTPGHFEKRRPANPLISSLVRYGEAVGLRLVLTLEGVEAPDPPAAATFLAMGFVGAAAHARLVAARAHLGLTQEEVSRRAGGRSRKAFCLFEGDDHEPHLATLQQYARALGGRYSARWEVLEP